MVQLLTLAQAKASINVETTTNDVEMQDYIDATRALVEEIVGAVEQRTVVETFYQPRALILSVTPVLSLVSVSDRGNAMDLADLGVDRDSGVVEILPGLLGLSALPWFAGPVTVTYLAGRTVVPPQVNIAARIIFAHLWRTQGRATTRPGVGGGGGGGDAGVVPGLGYAVPNRALQLLQGEMVTDGVA